MSLSSVVGSPQTLHVNGQLDEALHALSAQLRSRPADAALRVFPFQLLALQGEWERAANQLKAVGELDEHCVNASVWGEHAPLAQSPQALCVGGCQRMLVAGPAEHSLLDVYAVMF